MAVAVLFIFAIKILNKSFQRIQLTYLNPTNARKFLIRHRFVSWTRTRTAGSPSTCSVNFCVLLLDTYCFGRIIVPNFNRYLSYRIFLTSSVPNSTGNPILVENTEFRAHRNRFLANSEYFIPEFPQLLSLQGFGHEVSPHYICRAIFDG